MIVGINNHNKSTLDIYSIFEILSNKYNKVVVSFKDGSSKEYEKLLIQ